MTDYQYIYILSNPIYVLAIYNFITTFLNQKSYNPRIEFASYTVYNIVLSLMLFITQNPFVMLFFNILSWYLLTLNYPSIFQKRFISIILIYAITLVIEPIVMIGFNNNDFYLAMQNIEFESVLGLIIIRIATLILGYLIKKSQKFSINKFKVPLLYYVYFIIAMLGTLYLYIASLNTSKLNLADILTRTFIFLFINIIIILIDGHIYNLMLAENEKNILKEQNRAYENQIEIIKQSNESINIIKHDMKNHIIMLNEILKEYKVNEAMGYLSTIIDDIENKDICKSNNFVIDSIINFKLRNIKDRDIKVLLDVNVPVTVNILAKDLTSILSNLLDNAITGCEKSQNKILEIKISSKFNNLIIKINNSYNGNLIDENGELKTTKPFVSNHGFGIKSIKKTLEIYKGEIRTEYTNDFFSSSVIIPY